MYLAIDFYNQLHFMAVKISYKKSSSPIHFKADGVLTEKLFAF